MGGFWLHPISFLITGLILLIGTQYEYYNIIRNSGVNPRMVPGLVTGIAIYVISALVASGMIPVNSFLFIIPLVILIMILELYRKQDKPFDSLAHTFFPLIVYCCFLSHFSLFQLFHIQDLRSLIPH